MERRTFIKAIGGAAAAILPFAARAQQGERMRRIGVLTGAAADDPDALARQAAFVQGLQQLDRRPQRADRHSLGRGQRRRPSEICGRIGHGMTPNMIWSCPLIRS